MSTAALTNLRDYLYGTLSTSELMWLVEELKVHAHNDSLLKPYTMEELQARIALSELDSAEGRFKTHEALFSELI